MSLRLLPDRSSSRCPAPYCTSAVVGRPAGVRAHRRFLVTSGGTLLMPNDEVSLRIVADEVTLVDAVGLPSIERYEACGRRCSKSKIARELDRESHIRPFAGKTSDDCE